MSVVVTGKTWELRDRLKSLGGRWNDDAKHWEFYTLSPEHRRDFNAHVGVMISDTLPPRRATPIAVDDWDAIEARAPGKTNMFGDDQTWFNYFADQNPVAYFGFTSLSALAHCVESIPQSIVRDETNDRNGAWERGRFEWYASECMPDAIGIARDGWSEGVELAQEVHEKLIGRHAVQRRRKHSVSGGSVNIGRLLAGNPDHMISRPKQPGKKIVTFFTESSFANSIKSEHIIIRAALIAAIVDILEANGFSCEIVATANTVHRRKPSWQIVTVLKAAGETLALNDIVFALGHTSYFRRLNLGLMALDPDLIDVWESGGMPSDAFTKKHPTKPNEIYIGRIEHSDRFKIDNDAPLITKAMQIFDIVFKQNLPIELNREGIDA